MERQEDRGRFSVSFFEGIRNFFAESREGKREAFNDVLWHLVGEGGYQIDNKMDLVLFNSYDGLISLSVAVENETVWLALDQLAELFGRDKSTISRHIRNVYSEGELERTATVANFATVQEEGKRLVERRLDY